MNTVEAATGAAISHVARRYYKWVPRYDLECHAAQWFEAHPVAANALLRRGFEPLYRRMRVVLERHARDVKARKSGYDKDDEYYYSLGQLARLLFDAFDSDATSPALQLPDSVAAQEQTFSDWEASIADVRQGLRKIELAQYAVLEKAVDSGAIDGDVFVSALRALQRQLGGPRPGSPEQEGE